MDHPARRPGRPALDAADTPSVSVHVRIPARQYDAVYQAASSSRVSVPELIRRRVAAQAHDDDDELEP